jgi:alpha-methylacyl-CoA racemase
MTLLNGLKILDFSSMTAGPLATRMFADLGADVIHIESNRRIDMIRVMPPYDEEHESVIHQHINRNKQSISLNLKEPEAIQIIHTLLQDYDIIVESFRPGVMKRLGLDYETLVAINPQLIYCSITGYGQEGPFAQRPGHDINYLSVAGTLHHSRHQQQKPVAMGIQVSDYAAGAMQAAFSILAAVYARTKTNKGQAIDVAMTDAAFSMNTIYGAQYFGSGRIPEPEEEILNGGTFYDYYETKDGRYFSVGSIEPPFRKLLCEALGIPELIESTFNASSYTQTRFKEAIRDAFCSKTFEEWLDVFDEQFLGCVEPVLNFEEACNHPHIQARQLIVEMETVAGAKQSQIAHPVKFSDAQPIYKFIGAKIGEHTEAILGSIGYSEDEIKHLKIRGVLA